MGVGPSAAPRLVGALLAGLGIAHWVVAWRGRGRVLEVDRGNHRSLAWVMGALVGLIVVLQFGGGFVLASAWLFVATARGFGEALRARSVALGLGLALLVYLFFTRVLTLALPAGPLERLLWAEGRHGRPSRPAAGLGGGARSRAICCSPASASRWARWSAFCPASARR